MAHAPPLLPIAALWRRVAALAIDGSLLACAGMVAGMALHEPLTAMGPWARLLGLAAALLYLGLGASEITGGQTLGKRLLGIRVADARGAAPSAGQALSRTLLLVAPWFAAGARWWPQGSVGLAALALAGFLAVGLGPALVFHLLASWRVRQGLHDRLAGTFVVPANAPTTRLPQPSASWPLLVLAFGWVGLAAAGIAASVALVPRVPQLQPALALGGALARLPDVYAVAVGAGVGPWSGDGTRVALRTTLWTSGSAGRADALVASAGRVLFVTFAKADQVELISVSVRRGWDLGIAWSFEETLEQHAPDRWREKLSLERQRRQAPVAEIAPAPLPASDPAESAVLAGVEGTDADGYPTRWVDRAVLRGMLLRGLHQPLTRAVEHLQEEFERDPRKEDWPADAASALGSGEPDLLPHLDAWVRASPDSFAPWLARGAHWTSAAFLRRGGNWARLTPGDDFRAMDEALEKAHADLERAVALRPKLVAALTWQIRANLPRHDSRSRSSAVVARALAVCRSCYQVQAAYLHSLLPRWGGSYQAMRTFIRRHPDPGNPRLRRLPGLIDIDRAHIARSEGRHALALAAAERACALGEDPAFLLTRADIKERMGRAEEALADLDRSLDLRPASPEHLYERALLLARLKRYPDAARDLRAALQLEPAHPLARAAHQAVVRGLIHGGYQEVAAGRREAGVKLYDLAAELDPMNGEIQQRRKQALAPAREATGDAVAAAEEAARGAPDDFEAVRRLDYALAQRREFEKVVGLWTDYLARHPGEGRAYLERGGALHHLRRLPEALADARQACALGVSEGCAIARRVEAQAR